MTRMGCTDHLGGVTSAISTALMPKAHTSTCKPCMPTCMCLPAKSFEGNNSQVCCFLRTAQSVSLSNISLVNLKPVRNHVKISKNSLKQPRHYDLHDTPLLLSGGTCSTMQVLRVGAGWCCKCYLRIARGCTTLILTAAWSRGKAYHRQLLSTYSCHSYVEADMTSPWHGKIIQTHLSASFA